MSNWVKFEDLRMPTESDMNHKGKVVIQHDDGTLETADVPWILDESGRLEIRIPMRWLENIPDIPKPRTLEDVAKDIERWCRFYGADVGSLKALIDEMRTFIEGENDA